MTVHSGSTHTHATTTYDWTPWIGQYGQRDVPPDTQWTVRMSTRM